MMVSTPTSTPAPPPRRDTPSSPGSRCPAVASGPISTKAPLGSTAPAGLFSLTELAASLPPHRLLSRHGHFFAFFQTTRVNPLSAFVANSLGRASLGPALQTFKVSPSSS
jgi:hypothetical protein